MGKEMVRKMISNKTCSEILWDIIKIQYRHWNFNEISFKNIQCDGIFQLIHLFNSKEINMLEIVFMSRKRIMLFELGSLILNESLAENLFGGFYELHRIFSERSRDKEIASKTRGEFGRSYNFVDVILFLKGKKYFVSHNSDSSICHFSFQYFIPIYNVIINHNYPQHIIILSMTRFLY